jgi:hypothetical protein
MGGPVLPSPEEAAWQLSRPEDSLINSIVVSCSICPAFATLFFGLRVWSRRLHHRRYRLELSDWLCLVALVFFIANEVVISLATRYGFGRHIVFITDPRLVQILSLCSENFYAVVLALLKLSVLALYRQLFSSSHRFLRVTWGMSFVVASLGIWVILASDLQCIPIQATWDLTVRGNCINYGLSGLLAYIVNIITDIIILSMPIPLVLKLHVSRQRKWMLIATFATGGSACIVSIVQLRYVPKLGSTADATWDNAPIAIVASVECMIGFLAVSLATYRPLYRHFVLGTSLDTEGSKQSTGSGYNSNPKSLYSAHVSATPRSRSETLANPSYRGITATDQVELVHHVNESGKWIIVGS